MSYTVIVQLLDNHFTPKRFGFAEKSTFYSATQQPGESHTQWAARIRGLAAHCNFKNLEEALLDRFIMGMATGHEKDKLFAQDQKDLTLAKAVELAESVRCARRAAAGAPGAAGAGLAGAAPGSADVFNISKKPKCSVCGFTNHKTDQCGFKNYKCKRCGKKGHLRKMCSYNKEKVKFVDDEGNEDEGDDEILFKDLPPPYRENEEPYEEAQQEVINQHSIPPCEVLDLLANCKITKTEPSDSEAEYAEIQDMGLWHSTPLSHRHKSKISLTWVLKENLENTKPQKFEEVERYQRQFEDRLRSKERVVGRNEYYHNLRFRSACEEFVSQDTLSDETSATEEYVRRKHRHRHRRKKRNQERFGYDIRDLDSFLSEASIDRPGNIPVVIAYPSTLYQTQREPQRELSLPLGTVVNAVFKNQQWVYAQTPHGDEGYVAYSACLPLGILPNRTSPQKKQPCWESSTDIYPRPCGNLTDNEKEQLRTRTRSESRYKPRSKRCAEKDFDTLYLKTKSVNNMDKLQEKGRQKVKRRTLLVVNSDYSGGGKTLTVREGDVVSLVGAGETDVDADWFYVRKKDGSQGFIPASIAGHGYI